MAKTTKTLLRAYSPHAEIKYVGMRHSFSHMILLDETFDKTLKMFLAEQYDNPAEGEATLKLTGYIGAMQKARKWKATREDYLKWQMLADKSRWDRFSTTRAEAQARFFSGKSNRKIADIRPLYYAAKSDTPYKPRRGSSTGRIKTIRTGAVRVERDFAKMMEAIFSLGDAFNKGKKAKMPKVSVSRTFTKY